MAHVETREIHHVNHRTAALAVLAVLSAPTVLHASDADSSATTAPATAPTDLATRLEQAEQRIRILERKLELDEGDAKTAASTVPQVKASPAGVSLASADGSTSIRLRGTLNVDEHTYFSDKQPSGAPLAPGSNTFLLRRARPYIEGALGDLVGFRLMPDFAQGKTVLQDAYVTAGFKPWFKLTAGKFKSPFGLEFLQFDADIRFPERALPTDLVPARDLGVQFSGDLAAGRLSWALAVLNGAADGQASDSNSSPDLDNNNDKDLVARLFAQPFLSSDHFALRGLGIGIAASGSHGRGQFDSTGAATNALLPGLKTTGQQTWFSWRGGTTPTAAWGDHDRISPQAWFYYQSFGLLAEYVSDRQDVRRVISPALTRTGTLTNNAWQLALNWFVTGEDEGYVFPAPKHPYSRSGAGWGALELNARISELTIDSVAFSGGANSYVNPVGSPRRATEWTAGITWALTQNLKFLLDYDQTAFEGGGSGTADSPTEKLLFGRFAFNL